MQLEGTSESRGDSRQDRRTRRRLAQSLPSVQPYDPPPQDHGPLPAIPGVSRRRQPSESPSDYSPRRRTTQERSMMPPPVSSAVGDDLANAPPWPGAARPRTSRDVSASRPLKQQEHVAKSSQKKKVDRKAAKLDAITALWQRRLRHASSSSEFSRSVSGTSTPSTGSSVYHHATRESVARRAGKLDGALSQPNLQLLHQGIARIQLQDRDDSSSSNMSVEQLPWLYARRRSTNRSRTQSRRRSSRGSGARRAPQEAGVTTRSRGASSQRATPSDEQEELRRREHLPRVAKRA